MALICFSSWKHGGGLAVLCRMMMACSRVWLVCHATNGRRRGGTSWHFGPLMRGRKHGGKRGSRKSTNISPKRGRKTGPLPQSVGKKQKNRMRMDMRTACIKHPNPHPHPHPLKRNLRFPKKGREFPTISSRISMRLSRPDCGPNGPFMRRHSSRITGEANPARMRQRSIGRRRGGSGFARRSSGKAGREDLLRRGGNHSFESIRTR